MSSQKMMPLLVLLTTCTAEEVECIYNFAAHCPVDVLCLTS